MTRTLLKQWIVPSCCFGPQIFVQIDPSSKFAGNSFPCPHYATLFPRQRMTDASWLASVQAECDPRSFPFQFVHKAYQHSSFRFRLFDTGPELVGLSLPPSKVLFFLFDPALLDKNILASLTEAVTPTHTLIMGQFRSASLSRAPFSRALLFHITPFPISTSIINPLEVAHIVLVLFLQLQREYEIAANNG
jgi:hypothetical protein